MKKLYNTTVKTKEKYYKKFSDLIGQQFSHGGDKYKLNGFPDREATDLISSVFGGELEDQWILGTVTKYLMRWNNFHREKDILKAVTYLYLLWLKQGFHLQSSHDTDTRKDGKKTGK